MGFDLSLVSPDAVVAPAAIEPINATPPARRGRGGAQAQQPDPDPAPPVAPPPISPERQALINALYSAKTRRDAERLQETS